MQNHQSKVNWSFTKAGAGKSVYRHYLISQRLRSAKKKSVFEFCNRVV